MSRKATRLVATHLDVIPFAFAASPEDLDWVTCDRCRVQLGLHQPDPIAPARLLGVCDECRRWFLILVDARSSSAMMVALPENQFFQAVWEKGGAADGVADLPDPRPSGAAAAPVSGMPAEDGRILEIHDERPGSMSS